jgi:hypothetical protein
MAANPAIPFHVLADELTGFVSGTVIGNQDFVIVEILYKH